MTHRASEIRVLVARARRIILLLVQERSRKLLLSKDFKDEAIEIRAKVQEVYREMTLRRGRDYEGGRCVALILLL